MCGEVTPTKAQRPPLPRISCEHAFAGEGGAHPGSPGGMNVAAAGRRATAMALIPSASTVHRPAAPNTKSPRQRRVPARCSRTPYTPGMKECETVAMTGDFARPRNSITARCPTTGELGRTSRCREVAAAAVAGRVPVEGVFSPAAPPPKTPSTTAKTIATFTPSPTREYAPGAAELPAPLGGELSGQVAWRV
jgi:hypothetical protein